MAAGITKYHQVLQEESERVCGKHLPDEIVWMILYKWGGLQTPSGAVIRNLMATSSRNSLGQRHRLVPYGLFSKGDIGELISQEQLDDPATEFVMHVSNVRLVRQTVATENLSKLLDQHAYTMRSTAQGPVLVWVSPPSILYERTSPCAIWKWQGLDMLHEPPGDGIRMRKRYLWAMAAKYRGVSELIVAHGYRTRATPTATKPELYQLLLRAETDHTWRFWYDLCLAHKYYCLPVFVGNTVGFMLHAGLVSAGARCLQSKMPGVSFSMACLGFLVTSRCFGKFAALGCGLLTDHWLIPHAPQIGRR